MCPFGGTNLNRKRILRAARAGLAAALFLCCLAGCTFSTPRTVLTIDGTEVSAGVYLLTQYQAYLSAKDKLTDAQANVLTADVEGKKGAEWIHDETIQNLRRFVYTEKRFAEKGFSFTEEERSAMDAAVENVWASAGAVLTANGVGRESYRAAYENTQKYQKLLKDYTDSPEGAVSVDDAKAYMDKEYVRVQMLSLPVTGADYDALPEEEADKVREKADGLVAALSDGGKLDDLAAKTLEEVFGICGREYSDDLLTNYLTASFLTKEDATYSAEFLQSFFDAEKGYATVNNDFGLPIVFQKIDNYESDAQFKEEYYDSLASEISTAAFADMVKAEMGELDVTENASAVRTYSPKKIRETV